MFPALNAKIDSFIQDDSEREISKKIFLGERLTDLEALYLYKNASLDLLSILSTFVRERINAKQTFFNKNFHIEPTNVCVFTCSFCSFSRILGEEGSWELTLDDVRKIAVSYKDKEVTEAHIVGGVHPKRDVKYYAELIKTVKKELPKIHIKAFTAVELEVMFARSKLTIKEGLLELKAAGLDSIPGGGAEIFHPDIRSKICRTKATAETWLEIHKTSHNIGIPSNCTMLYGHIENYEHRIDHMRRLRELQDSTKGFNCFIPLKYRHENNDLSHLAEISEEEDLKNYAIARLYLDNIPHLKAYWPMIGKNAASKSLAFGVDDLDGTIDDSTKIYSMAGVEDQNPSMSTDELISIIKNSGYLPVERDSIYGIIKNY
ncbi:MAG: aminofutalosine synthase MqnE [bacterium]|nr:aminofutalosine synthase MqnE [bacterium]